MREGNKEIKKVGRTERKKEKAKIILSGLLVSRCKEGGSTWPRSWRLTASRFYISSVCVWILNCPDLKLHLLRLLTQAYIFKYDILLWYKYEGKEIIVSHNSLLILSWCSLSCTFRLNCNYIRCTTYITFILYLTPWWWLFYRRAATCRSRLMTYIYVVPHR